MVPVVVPAVEPLSAARALEVVDALALLAVPDHGLLVLVALAAVPAPVMQTVTRHRSDVETVCKANKQKLLTRQREGEPYRYRKNGSGISVDNESWKKP